MRPPSLCKRICIQIRGGKLESIKGKRGTERESQERFPAGLWGQKVFSTTMELKVIFKVQEAVPKSCLRAAS